MTTITADTDLLKFFLPNYTEIRFGGSYVDFRLPNGSDPEFSDALFVSFGGEFTRSAQCSYTDAFGISIRIVSGHRYRIPVRNSGHPSWAVTLDAMKKSLRHFALRDGMSRSFGSAKRRMVPS